MDVVLIALGLVRVLAVIEFLDRSLGPARRGRCHRPPTSQISALTNRILDFVPPRAARQGHEGLIW
jgi:hypothetical protein